MTQTDRPAPEPVGLPLPVPRWNLVRAPEPADVQRLEVGLRLPKVFCRLLAARGLTSPGEAKRFLRPRLSHLLDPAGLLGASQAASRLARAVERGQCVFVHGDYDVDGIAGTALAVGWLRGLGCPAQGFVPARSDGYDLSAPGVEQAAAAGARVLMTVDCGMRAHAWVQRATERGMDVIVTDHHVPGASLPPAHAVVNPNQRGCAYANKGLCGAAVAFKVLQLAARMLGRPAAEAWRHLDLVGLATLADQVPLVGENRALARLGLHAVGQTARPGLRRLALEACGAVGEGRPDWEDAVFRLAPRINAAGRVGDPATALGLLLAEDAEEARGLAETLERDNATRKALQRRTLDEALEELAGAYDPERDRAVVLAREGWPAGVVGIVASQLVERLSRPVVLFALDGEAGRGSARSVAGFDVHAALADCAEHLGRWGGHPMAAGMDLRADRVPAFGEAFRNVARRRLADSDLRPAIDVDLEVGVEDLRGPLPRWCRYLAPFGPRNREPVFLVRGVRAERPRRIGDGSHLGFRMSAGRAGLPAIGFGLGRRHAPEDVASGPMDVAFALAEDRLGLYPTVKARALDIRRSDHPLDATRRAAAPRDEVRARAVAPAPAV